MYTLLFFVPFVTLTCSKKDSHSSYDLVYSLLPSEYAKNYKPLFGKEFTSNNDRRTLHSHLLHSDFEHTKYYRSFDKDEDPLKKHENDSDRGGKDKEDEDENEEQKDVVIDRKKGKKNDRKNTKRIIGFGQIWIRKGGRRKLDANSCKWMYIKPFCFMQKGYIVCSKKKKSCKEKPTITRKEASHRFLRRNETAIWSGFDKLKLIDS